MNYIYNAIINILDITVNQIMKFKLALEYFKYENIMQKFSKVFVVAYFILLKFYLQFIIYQIENIKG